MYAVCQENHHRQLSCLQPLPACSRPLRVPGMGSPVILPSQGLASPATPAVPLSGPTDLRAWLSAIGCEDYYEDFEREDITPDVLCDLQKEDLKALISKVGDRLRIYAQICRLRQDPAAYRQNTTSLAFGDATSGSQTPVSSQTPIAGHTPTLQTPISSQAPGQPPNQILGQAPTSVLPLNLPAGTASGSGYSPSSDAPVLSQASSQASTPKYHASNRASPNPAPASGRRTYTPVSNLPIARSPTQERSPSVTRAPDHDPDRSVVRPDTRPDMRPDARPEIRSELRTDRSPDRPTYELPIPNGPMLSFLLPDGSSIAIPREGSGAVIRERAMAKAGLSPTKFQILDAFDFIDTDEDLWERAQETSEFEIWPVKEEPTPEPVPPPLPTLPARGNSLRVDSMERPTSLHVSNHLSEFFPQVHPKELEKSIQQARQVVHRMSTISHKDPRHSRRMSSLLVTDASIATGTPTTKKRMSSLNTLTKAGPVVQLSGEEDEFLDQFDKEMKAPTKWERGRHIGSGSHGEVYMALNHFNFEFLAVKQVPLNGVSRHHDAMVRSLSNEIDMLSELVHENIVQYRGYKLEGDFLNIFLEYVPGGSLANRNFNNGQPLNEALLRRILPQILSGLTYLHAQNIVHRDIKGANVLVADGLKVKISDFGLSRRATAVNRFSMKGSPFWMAPEAVRGEPMSTKADIWSLGCLVIEIMTGHHPFPELDGDQAIFQIGNHYTPRLPTDISPQLQDFIQSTLNLSPDARPDAAELSKHPFLTNP